MGNLLIAGILLLIGVHTFSLIRRGKWLALDPLNSFWAGVLAVYVIEPLQHAETFISWHASGVFEWTLFWSLAAFICVVTGYEVGWGADWVRKLPAMPTRTNPGRLAVVSFVLIGLGVGSYAYMIATAGGLWEWLSVPRGGTNWAVVNGYLAQMRNFLPIGVILLVFLNGTRQASPLVTAVTWALAGVLLLWFIYLGARGPTILLVVGVMAAYYLPRDVNPPAWFMGTIFVALLVVLQFMAMYRCNFTDLSFHLDQIDVADAQERLLPEFLGGNRHVKRSDVTRGADFNCVMTVVELVPKAIDYNHGYCLLEFLTRPIPRSLWPEKIYPHYEAFTPIYDHGALSTWEVGNSHKRIVAGPAFTFVGHWYAVGGPVVLALAGFLTGCLFRMIRTVYDRAPRSHGNMLLYFLLIPIGFQEAASTPLFWIFSLPLELFGLLAVIFLCREIAGGMQVKRKFKPAFPGLMESGELA